MSTTERYGTAIWDAIVKMEQEDESGWFYATVGEVAERAGVSKPTASKYLDKLYQMGKVTFFKTRNNARYYRTRLGEVS